jgi:geranylgeranyl reductase family protein
LEYDVIVVGAGPTGSTAARFCAREGLRTLLIEKDRLPRYKPCGGCLSPRVLGEFDFDIGGVIESTVHEAKFTFRLGEPFSIWCEDPIGYLVMRESFDHLLWRKAQEGGADLYEGRRVSGFHQDEEGVDVFITGGESIRCRYLVGADGARSIVAQSLRGGLRIKAGMACEGEGRWPTGLGRKLSFVHLDFGGIPNGYGWIFPKGDRISMGIGTLFPSRGVSLKSRFERFVHGVNYVGAVEMERVSCHPLPTFSGGDVPVARGRVLLAGDAANLMDPMTGEGIYYAVKSGHIAGETIAKAVTEDRGEINEYHDVLRRELFDDLTVALKLARTVYRFPKMAYTILKSTRSMDHLYLNVLAGNIRYGSFYGEIAERIRGRFGGKITGQKRLDNQRFILL